MRHAVRASLLLTLSYVFSFAPGLQAQQTAEPPSPAATRPSKEAKKRLKKQLKELDREGGSGRISWLREEVPDIITDDERKAFLQLSTTEEREQFIESFWNRRNPSPDSSENTVKEEHYRRLAYANEHFYSGIPGRKTDRGHVYILWGPPDEIESHPTGGTYYRSAEEGGGSTSTYPWEKWRYRHLEDIGENIELEFVDPTGSGEYHITRDPGEKDALAHVPGAGLGDLERLGLSSKAARYTSADGTTLPAALGGRPAGMNEFELPERTFRVMRPPAHFKELDPYVTTRFIINQLAFDYAVDYLRITSDSDLVPITVQIANRELAYRGKDGIHTATLNIYARLTTLTGRLVQTFEEVLTHDLPESLFQSSLNQSSIYQKTVPLRPGLYRLDLVLKDVESGNVGIATTSLRVPRFDGEKLEASNLLLADQIQPVPSSQLGSGQFVLGGYKVRPRLGHEFNRSEMLGIWLQLYNLQRDESSHKNDVTVAYRLTRDHQEIWKGEDSAEQLHQTSEMATVQRVLPLAALPPGRYTIELTATDHLSGQTVSRSADFTVKASMTLNFASLGYGEER